MRAPAILVAVACLHGCEDRYGTYITITAGTKDQAFDTLDLYFGVDARGAMVATPKHAQVNPDRPSLSVRRQIAETDHKTFDSRVSEYTVWIPDGGENDELGPYLLAIASAGGVRVGSGELFDFHITTDREAVLYDLTLDPFELSDFEEWGRGAHDGDCLRYERDRGPDRPEVVAIGRDDDVDCDSFADRGPEAVDCEPLIFCDGQGGAGCIGRSPCLHDENQCSVGVCANKDGSSLTCAEDACVDDVLCETCDLSKPPAEILECALLDTSTHPATDLPVPVRGDGRLCRDPMDFDVGLPFPCTNAAVEAVAYYQDSAPFAFEAINPGPAPNVCRIRISSTESDAPFAGVPHLLVTVDSAGRRLGFVVGLIESGGACPSGNEPIMQPYTPFTGTCPMPHF